MFFRLSYISEAVGMIGLPDLRALEHQARTSNAALDITGAMCLIEGHFVQVLEGERLTVSRLFERITADPRHVDVELLGASHVARRCFAAWSMRVAMFGASSIAAQAYRRMVSDGPFDRRRWDADTALLVLDAACHDPEMSVAQGEPRAA